MKLIQVFTSFFLISSSLASPTLEQWSNWQHRRGLSSEGFHSSPIELANITSPAFAPDANVPSTNWAGAGYRVSASGDPWELVTGRFTVPTATGSSNVVAIWVGIDGRNGPPVIQGGIYITTDANGAATYQSWTEWIPDAPVFYDQTFFAYSPGDVLTIGIAVTAGAATADFIIENETTGANKDVTFSPSDSTNVAQGQAVEWVVERPTGFTLMNFGTVEFSNIVAQTSTAGYDLSSADTFQLVRSQSDSTVIASSSITGTNSLQVIYTGP